MAKRKKAVKKKKTAKKKKAKKTKRGKRGSWTAADLKLLRKLFGNNSTAEVSAQLGRPTEAVKKKASRMGLKKSRKYMKTLGR